MASHLVMMPPGGSPEQRLEQAVFVKDGFSWPGFLVPPLWLLWHRLWLEAILALLAMAAFSGFGEAFGMPVAGSALGLLVSLYVGLEGQAMRMAAMRRRGWLDWGVVEADRRDAVELRYAVAAADTKAEPEPSMSIVADATTPRRIALPTLGLVSYPQRP